MEPHKRRITIKCTCDQYKDISTPCCEDLIQKLNDCHNHLYYSRKNRQYAIDHIGESTITCIYYCPWCGKRLPEGLKIKRREVLEKEYGIVITEPWNKKQLSQIPEEFNTDEWWKKRGL